MLTLFLPPVQLSLARLQHRRRYLQRSQVLQLGHSDPEAAPRLYSAHPLIAADRMAQHIA